MVRRSKGEIAVAKTLEDLSLQYVTEKKLDGTGLCRYDFFLEKEKLFIEYDGVQHFERSSQFHKSDKQFLKGQRKDVEKTIYAISQGYRILRIHHSFGFDKANIAEIIVRAIQSKDSILVSHEEAYSHIYRGIEDYQKGNLEILTKTKKQIIKELTDKNKDLIKEIANKNKQLEKENKAMHKDMVKLQKKLNDMSCMALESIQIAEAYKNKLHGTN